MADKILMTTMGLDIGGAETHIIELSKELVRRGYKVCIAAKYGSFVPEIEAEGIKHYNIPMDTRNLKDMIISYRMLKQVILKEKPNIVHAHARIPAFICRLLQRKLKFHFVTTCHGVYDSTGILKYLTNWGDRTIVVSADMINYLERSYEIPNDKIKVTINGIDTTKFHPDNSPDEIRKEFNIPKEAKVVTLVSRLDDFVALGARQLVEAAPSIQKLIPDIYFLIAGNGDVFDEINASADKANAEIGSKRVIMCGARTDINKVIAAGDIFCGVSRAALEAMSAGKPTILTGYAGYLGIFEKSILDYCIKTNFCRNPSCPSTVLQIIKDVVKLFSLTPEEFKRISDESRDAVCENYSVARMTDDTVSVYDKTRRPKINVVMSGYYGYNNIGDEAILQSVHNNIASLDANTEITALSGNKTDTFNRYGIRSIGRFNALKVLKTIRHSDILVSGGGSLLQDMTSTRSLLYYLGIIKLAKHYRKKVIIYANGMGPLKKPSNRKHVKNTISDVDIITVRDTDSANEIRNLGIKNPNVYITADPVFTVEMPESTATTNRLLSNLGIKEGDKFFIISTRSWPIGDKFFIKLGKLCDFICDKYKLKPLFLSMQSPNDNHSNYKVMKSMKNKSYLLSGKYYASDMLAITARSEFVLSMRLHTLIFAASAGIPFIGFNLDPKIDTFIKLFDMPRFENIRDFDIVKAIHITQNFIDTKDSILDRYTKRSEELKELAKETDKYLLNLFNRIETEKR